MSRRARSTARKKTAVPAAPPARAAAAPFDMYAYWLMPHGLRGLLTTVFWPAARTTTPGRGGTGRTRVGPRGSPGRAASPPPRPPFLVLAPGKLDREVGEHTFWRGDLWGRTVALQGDRTFTKFDLFELAEGRILYWGTFRGNGYYDSEESHSFSSPFAWMDRWMSVGDFKQQRITDSLFDPRLRRVTNSAELTLRVEIVAHHDSWRDPDSGIQYADVLEMHYWSRHPEESSREVYHLGNGLGTIRFETLNRREPSGVRLQYAERFERFTPPDVPTLPWFDPFHNATYVPNGFFDGFRLPPRPGGAVTDYLPGWSGSGDAVITTDAPDEGTGPWRIALRGRSGGGDSGADFVIPTDWIPVTPGKRYRLSGSLWRVSEADNVYLDFGDGVGQGGSFDDAQALARRTHRWERLAAETTVSPTTTAIRIRCVRDGTSEGNAYFDGITLQRVD